MHKPAALRLALEQALPELQQHASQLHLFIEKGRVHATANTLSFTQHYELTVLISDCTTPIETLTWHILNWLQIHQPDLVRQTQQERMQFAAEVLDHHSADIEFTLSLNEHFIVDPETGNCQSLPEPDFQHFPLGQPWATSHE